jgi:hypothetical protein
MLIILIARTQSRHGMTENKSKKFEICKVDEYPEVCDVCDEKIKTKYYVEIGETNGFHTMSVCEDCINEISTELPNARK